MNIAVLPEEPPSTFRTRPTLLFRLRDWRDEATWSEFYGLYHRFVYAQARGAGLDHHAAEEVTHDVFQRVAETIADFEVREQRGSFRRWLINLTRWRIADLRRRQARIPGLGGDSLPAWDDASSATAAIERLPAEDGATTARHEREWQHVVVESALARLARTVAPQHLQVFQLHHRDEWPLVRVARELGINVATAYIINHRLKKQLRREVERMREQVG